MPFDRKRILVLGGARGGKSRFAQELAGNFSNKVLFVATGEPLDEEMQSRIEQHKQDRPSSWRTIETPVDIGRQVEKQIGDAEVVVIDCLTLLVSNLLGKSTDYLKAEKLAMVDMNELIACMDRLDVNFIIVSNEVGFGIVPKTKAGRIYRDLLGKVNQLIAQHADVVYLMVAGIPVKLKGD